MCYYGMIALPPPPAAFIERLKYVEPVGRLPKGYFDALVPATKQLLDKGWNTAAISDLFVAESLLPPGLRNAFRNVMRKRLSRLKRQRVSASGAKQLHQWRSGSFGSVHAVQKGSLAALCGLTETAWLKPDFCGNKCTRCQGVARKNGIEVKED
jgi:hypothetical protein